MKLRWCFSLLFILLAISCSHIPVQARPRQAAGEVYGEMGLESPGPDIESVSAVSDVHDWKNEDDSSQDYDSMQAVDGSIDMGPDTRFRRVGMFGKMLKKIGKKVKKVFKKVKHHVKKVFKKVAHHVKKVFKKVKSVAKKVFKAVTPIFKKIGKRFLAGGVNALLGKIKKRVASKITFDPPPPLPKRAPAPLLKPSRLLDPNFDAMDLPDRCPNKCTGHGKCLIDKGEVINAGNVRKHPYRCHCDPEWTGDACQSKVDMYIRWFESRGQLAMPKCCNVCPSQFKNPTNYGDLPVYQNPYSVTNCDPSLSMDSRPEAGGLPPCWRPLSSEPAQEPYNADASLLEFSEENTWSRVVAYIELHDQITRRNMYAGVTQANAPVTSGGDVNTQDEAVKAKSDAIKAKEAEAIQIAKQLQAEYKYRMSWPIAPCCIFCDFDFWAQENARPRKNPLPTGSEYFRALEKQRIAERVGSAAVQREMLRREEVRAAENPEQTRITHDDGSFVETRASTLEESSEESRMSPRELRRIERARLRQLRKQGSEVRRDPNGDMPLNVQKCCTVCPDPALGPNIATSSTKETMDKFNSRVETILSGKFKKKPAFCCNSCPSQFWLQAVTHDRDPFWGPKSGPPGGGESDDEKYTLNESYQLSKGDLPRQQQ